MSLIMVFLMIGSIAAILIYNPNKSIKINGFKFQEKNNLYYTKVKLDNEELSLSFNFLPSKEININYDAINLLRTAPFIATTFNPNMNKEDLSYLDYVRYHFAKSIRKVGEGVIKYSDNYNRLPLITCDNSSINMPVVYFINNYSLKPSIELNGTCVLVKGYGSDLIRAENNLVYAYYGILNK